MRFLFAIIIAAIWELWQKVAGVRAAWRDRAAVSVLPEIVAARLAHCATCPIYFKPLRTCGSPLMRGEWPDRNKPIGCFCYMPVKAGTETNCWAYDETGGVWGWPSQLNSFPIDA